MAAFISKMIIRQAKISIEKGVAKYKAYFVSTRLYEEYRADVDTILQTEGYEDCIVVE